MENGKCKIMVPHKKSSTKYWISRMGKLSLFKKVSFYFAYKKGRGRGRGRGGGKALKSRITSSCEP
jgi:hypothetical protein